MFAVAAGTACYQPRRADQTSLYRVVSDHLERFVSVYEDRYANRYGDWRPVVGRVLERFLDCGILACGFMRVACQDCHAEYLVAFSCKGRGLCPSCPSCGQRRSQEFSAFLQQEVLEDVPYRHVVFTIPKILRPTFLRERRLLRLLSRCAWDTLRLGLETALERKVVPGAVVSVATAGDTGNPHPHLHSIVSAGAWDGRTGEFCPWPPWLRGELLTELFRREVLAMLVREERLSETTQERLLAWNPSGFSVFVGDSVEAHQSESRERLARYVVKPPIALERLSYSPETCRVTLSSTKRGEQRQITALDFLADLSVHVPDHGEHTVLYYGRASNRSRGERKKASAVAAEATSQTQPVTSEPVMSASRKSFRLSWAALLKKVWDVDALRCSRCQGTMRIIAAIQKVDVIVRILRSLGLYDKPRVPDAHHCEDRDPDVAARHPLLSPDREDGDSGPGADEGSVSDSGPDNDWPMDAPHTED